MKCETIYKATIMCKNYRKSVSSLKASQVRPLFSAGVLNLICSASRKRKRLEFAC